MEKIKDTATLRKGISISLVITILFTCGFVLGALTKAIDKMAVAPAPETTVVTTTQPPETTTAVPTTAAPTTTEPTTTEPTTTAAPETETTTTAPSEETSTTAPEEEPAKEPGFLAGLIISLLEFKKKIIDFIISLVSSF